MKMLRFGLPLLLLLAACSDSAPEPEYRPPEGIRAVGDYQFGTYPGKSDTEHLILPQRFMTDDDSLELFITPVSRLVWRIDLIIPEVPGEDDALLAVEKFLAPIYDVRFPENHEITLDQTRIKVEYAFGHGPRAVRCSFIDLANEEQFQREENSAEAVELRRKRQAREDIYILEDALRQYNLDTESYPETLIGLLESCGVQNWDGPYLDEIPMDPWGDAYIYRKTGDSFEIRCLSTEK